MKLVLVSTQLSVGGVQNQVRFLAEGMHKRGHEVLVVGLYGTDRLPGLDGVAQELLTLRQRSPLEMVSGARELRVVASDFGADVLHSHAVHANLISRIASYRSGTPLVSTIHSVVEGGRWHGWLSRFTFGLSNQTTAVSHAVRAEMERNRAAPRGRLAVQYNGIDPEFFAPEPKPEIRFATRKGLNIDSEDLMILAVGRLANAKGYPQLIEAMRLLEHAGNVKLLIAGDGPLREELTSEISRLELGDRIQLLGTRGDVLALMRAADVFVLPSIWEGFGLVLGEAMAAGRPIVSSDIGGCREAAGDAAIYVRAGDAVDLARGLSFALTESEDDRRGRVDLGRERVSRLFSPQTILDQWENRYLALTGTSGSATART